MAPNMDQNRDDQTEDRLQQLWDKMEPAMEAFYDISNPISRIVFFNIYNEIFNYSVAKTSGMQATNEFYANAGSSDLYSKIKQWLTDHLTQILKDGTQLEGEPLLRFYDSVWIDYRFSSRVLHGVCMYMNRHWVSRVRNDKNVTDVYEIYDTALVLWRERLFAQVTPAVLKLIDRDRKGDLIDKNLIKSVVDCCVELGIGKPDTNDVTREAKEVTRLSVYRQYFEEDMLKESAEFCSSEAAALISSVSVPEYMKLVLRRIEIETIRVRETMHTSTLPKLVRVVEKTMIEDYLQFFCAEFMKLLVAYEKDDLNRMYNLLSRIPNSGLPALRNEFNKHVTEQGILAISSCGEKAATDPNLYVETLLTVYKKYNYLVQEAFTGEAGFVTALGRACMKFVNENALTSGDKKPAKTSELLAKHCDMLLKKSNKNEKVELDEALSDAVTIFNFIEEKDVFQKFYRNFLAKRLVNQLSASDDAEALMVSKLKFASGIEFANPMERMIKDIRLSADFQSEFGNFMNDKTSLTFDFHFFVLTLGSWPFSNAQSKFLMPSELEAAVTAFTSFYNGKVSGRKLQWIWNSCTCDIKYKKYVFKASTFQMAVLLHFNSGDEFTIETLAANTGLDMVTLKQVLYILVKINLLKSTDTNAAALDNGSAPESAVITLNSDYKHKKLRHNIDVPLRVETNREDEKVRKTVEEDRKILVQAAIVRIMKMRQRITHQNLLAEVPPQLKDKFRPSVLLIKTCIDHLIEKEYMNREDVSPPEYTYIA